VEFAGLPPHVFAEYKRLADGSLAVHLVNMMPEESVTCAKIILPAGMKAVAEAPFGRDASLRDVADDGSLPPFVEYLLITVK
jgi:hypothetical protein